MKALRFQNGPNKQNSVSKSLAGDGIRHFRVLNLKLRWDFIYYAYYIYTAVVSWRLCGCKTNTYLLSSLTGWQRATERLAEFSWEARSKSNCSTVRRSRVLFLLQACPRKVGRPLEELIIRYEPSLG